MKPEIILLTDTCLFGEKGSGRYMGAYVLASQLKQAGFRTVVIDYFTQKENFFDYLSHFISKELMLIGISSTFLAPQKVVRPAVTGNRTRGVHDFYKGELWFDDGGALIEWTQELKELMSIKSPNAKLVLGGTKAQFAIWRPTYYKNFDYVCLGAADRSLVDLANSLKAKKIPKLRRIQNVQVIDNSIDTENKFCPSTVWDSSFAVSKKESLPLEIARGCVFNCKFCHYDKKQSFLKDIDRLEQELIKNYENFQTDTYHFCDDCFNDSPRKIEQICNLFQKLPFKIEWISYARVDVAVKFPETMDMMVESGATGLYLGLESFNHKVALNAGKGTPTEKVKEFLLEFQNKFSSQCLIEGSFIVGLPGETKQTQADTIEWITSNQSFDFLTIGSLGIMPYIHSFDKVVIDYAEYSRNPEKYGFKNIDYSRRYWEHESFTSDEAEQIAEEASEIWNTIKGFQKIKTVWQYTHFKTLGYSKEEIFSMAKDINYCQKFDTQNIISRFEDFKNNYWKNLIEVNITKS